MSDFAGKGVFPITPGSPMPDLAYGFYVTGAGNISGVDSTGSSFTNFPVAANSYHPWQVAYISSATATGIWGVKRPR